MWGAVDPVAGPYAQTMTSLIRDGGQLVLYSRLGGMTANVGISDLLYRGVKVRPVVEAMGIISPSFVMLPLHQSMNISECCMGPVCQQCAMPSEQNPARANRYAGWLLGGAMRPSAWKRSKSAQASSTCLSASHCARCAGARVLGVAIPEQRGEGQAPRAVGGSCSCSRTARYPYIQART